MVLSMGEKLQESLAGLADQLGISVGQLWDWMYGHGAEAYAQAKIAQLYVDVAIFATLLILMLVIGILAVRSVLKRKREKGTDSYEDIILCGIIDIGVNIVLISCFTKALRELLGWLASPEGMVMQMIFDAIR